MSGDEEPIAPEAGLLRRIHPDHVISDSNTGRQRPSSAAFKDPNLSVDVEPLLHSSGLDWQFSLRDHQSYSLVRFLAQTAYDQGLPVVRTDAPGNPAHAEVKGKKPQGKANALRDASEWVHLVNTT